MQSFSSRHTGLRAEAAHYDWREPRKSSSGKPPVRSGPRLHCCSGLCALRRPARTPRLAVSFGEFSEATEEGKSRLVASALPRHGIPLRARGSHGAARHALERAFPRGRGSRVGPSAGRGEGSAAAAGRVLQHGVRADGRCRVGAAGELQG